MLVLAGLLTAMLVCPSISFAGIYQVSACTESVGYVNHSWVFTTNSPIYIEAHVTCGEEAIAGDPAELRNIELGDTAGPHGVPVGAEGNWRFVPPVGTTISEVLVEASLAKVGGDQGWQIYLENEGTADSTQVVATCHTSAEENECNASRLYQMSGLMARAVSVGAVCDAEEYAPGQFYATCSRGNQFGHAVRAGFDEARVTISDPIAPTDISGTDLPSGAQHGTISILGSAVDTAAGLVSLSVVNDTNEVIGGPVNLSASCNYSFVTPCPIEVNDLAIPVDTTKLPNGRNQIRIEATNAAHDEGFSSPYTITVENGSPKQEGDTGYPSGGEPGAESKSSGSNLNESNGNPGNSGSSQTSSGAPGGQLTPVTKPPLPPLQLKTKVTRSIDGDLLISGLVSRGATGALDLVVHGGLTAHRVWSYKATMAVEHGRFRLRVHLPKRLGRRSVRISVSYPGGLFFGPTKVSLSIRARHSQTGR